MADLGSNSAVALLSAAGDPASQRCRSELGNSHCRLNLERSYAGSQMTIGITRSVHDW